jgi:thioredoxin-related protein
MSRMRPIFAPIVATFVTLVSVGSLQAQEINWRHDFRAAQREAQESGKPLFLDFGTQQCHWCQQLDATTFRVPAVARLLNDNFIPVNVDGNRDRELTGKLGVQSFPTLVMLDPAGRVINRQVGFCEAGPMTGFLNQGARVASSGGGRPQFRGQNRDDRIPAKALAMEEPARPAPPAPANERPQPAAAGERLQARVESIQLPSPEELGISGDKPAPEVTGRPIDWSALHARLNRLGALSFIVQRPSAQLVRLISLFPMPENRVHRVEVSAATEAEAVRLFIEQVEEWATHP